VSTHTYSFLQNTHLLLQLRDITAKEEWSERGERDKRKCAMRGCSKDRCKIKKEKDREKPYLLPHWLVGALASEQKDDFDRVFLADSMHAILRLQNISGRPRELCEQGDRGASEVDSCAASLGTENSNRSHVVGLKLGDELGAILHRGFSVNADVLYGLLLQATTHGIHD